MCYGSQCILVLGNKSGNGQPFLRLILLKAKPLAAVLDSTLNAPWS